MIFHGHLHTDEPPGGDYVRYLESLVGGPPEDAEQAAAELARRLAGRRPMTQPLDLVTPGGGAGNKAGAGPAVDSGRVDAAGTGVPTRAPAAIPARTPAAITPRPGPSLRLLVSRLLIAVGAISLGLVFMGLGEISMVPGAILLIAGVAIGPRTSRLARTRSGRP
ncbi:MAG: hypothetical protein OZ935_04515 [Pseudomonadota bacterium]|nr:hypothetical protein [Pseudomonadota bacterium]